MQFGAHCLMWTSVFSKKDLYLFDKLKDMGFDGIEIKLNNLSLLPVSQIEKKMSQTGLKCTFSLALDREHNILSDDEEKRKAGVRFLKERIEVASFLGSDVIGGPLYGAWGEFTGHVRTMKEWDHCKEYLSEVAHFAEKKRVTLALEPLNRYETYFLNTVEDAKTLVEEIRSPYIKILLDTYHMNIEEEHFYNSIKLAGSHLFHLHLCENNRGVPGTGHVNWTEVFRALKEIGYKRWAVIESFVPGADEEIVSRVRLWRKVAPSADVIAKSGLEFFKKNCNTDETVTV